MYRLSLASLWAGVALFAALSVIDAMLDFMGHLQGVFLAGGAACFVSAVLHAGLHRLNETAIVNRGRSEQVRDDVDQLREQVDCLTDKLVEVHSLTEARVMLDEDRAQTQEAAKPEPKPEECDAIVYQFRLRADDGTEVIAGNRSRDHVNTAEILAALDDNNDGTLPGRHSAS